MALQTGPFLVYYDTHHEISMKWTTIQATVTPTYVQVLNTTVEYTNLSNRIYYNFGVQFTPNAAPLYVNPKEFNATQLLPGVPITSQMVIQNNNYNPEKYKPTVAFAFMWSYNPEKNTPDAYFGAFTNQLPLKSGHCLAPGGGVQTCGIHHVPQTIRIVRSLKPKNTKNTFLEGPISSFWDYSDPEKPILYCPNIEVVDLDDEPEEDDKDTVLVPIKQKLTAKSN